MGVSLRLAAFWNSRPRSATPTRRADGPRGRTAAALDERGRAPGHPIAAIRTPQRPGAAMLQNFPLYAYFPAKDLARARRFYEDKVGLKPKMEIAGGVVYGFADGTEAFLYPTPNAGTSQASQAFWQVADVDAEIAELKSRGVVFEPSDAMP